MPVYDKYAPYVFAAYGVAALVLGALIIWSVWRLIAARRRLDALEKANGADARGEFGEGRPGQ
jgi:heme exporter protein CcmD